MENAPPDYRLIVSLFSKTYNHDPMRYPFERNSLTLFGLTLLLLFPATFACQREKDPEVPQEPQAPVSVPQGNGAVTGTEMIRVEVVARNLDTPWAMTFSPSGDIFFTERRGLVQQLLPDGTVRTLADLRQVVEQGESGLLGIAADPEFQNNRHLYVAYTYSRPSSPFNNRLVRLKADPATGQYAEDLILMDEIRGQANHSGGGLKFGPDQKLYWTVGDRFEPNLAQDPRSLNGKILRFEKDGSIPSDNPFPGSYVWSLGHRNPQGLAWQPGTNALYATEHGPSGSFPECCNDEINRIEKGKNYGWPLIRGDQTLEGYLPPVWFSGANITWAPGGATFITQGKWAGSLLWTGLRGRSLFRAIFDAQDKNKIIRVEQYLNNTHGRLREITQAPNGDIYLTTSNRDGRGAPIAEDDRILKLIIP